MRKLITTLLAASIILCSTPATSRDDRLRFSIHNALASVNAKQKLNNGVSFFFGEQAHGKVIKKLGRYSTSQKTNAFGKSDNQACEWAFLSALISLQQRALREGGNAVINIHSNYKGVEFKSDTEFECGAGAVIAGVALKGTVVKLKESAAHTVNLHELPFKNETAIKSPLQRVSYLN